MLTIKNLKAEVEGKEILKGINLHLGPGEVHAIMGPNGSGKSTLSYVLAGREDYDVTAGEIMYNGTNLEDMSVDERARKGIFLAFQYPVEIPGVSTSNFLKSILNAIRKEQGKDELDAMDMLMLVKEKIKMVGMDQKLLSRPLNEGFSGGEKKRNEVLQMAILEPQLAILDETDSGLDIDALRIVADGVNQLRSKERSFLIITHYQRLLNYIVPDYVHIMQDGKIIKSGDKNLAIQVEDQGYDWLKTEEVTTS